MNELFLLQYEDEDKDKVILESDEDLIAAVDHAKVAGWKVRIFKCLSVVYEA